MMMKALFSLVALLFDAALLVQAASNGEATSSDQQTTESPSSEVDYLIVGAGGSGIQLALFFEKHGIRSYTILEKEDVVGSFWTKFPVFEELISVNKNVRDPRERLRYDWHSMLEAPVTMWNITKDYFPKGIHWHHYMTSVVKEAGIRVEHGVEVDSIVKGDAPCVRLVDSTLRCANKRVFIGTGLKEKPEPLLRAMGGIPYSAIKKELAQDRRVCIAGNGNSGFEVAQNTFDVAERVTLYGRHPHRLSSITKYTGDVRVKYLQVRVFIFYCFRCLQVFCCCSLLTLARYIRR